MDQCCYRLATFPGARLEVLFVHMVPVDGEYEPLLGYIALEQCGAAVDLIGHRLLPVRAMDLKRLSGLRPVS